MGNPKDGSRKAFNAFFSRLGTNYENSDPIEKKVSIFSGRDSDLKFLVN